MSSFISAYQNIWNCMLQTWSRPECASVCIHTAQYSCFHVITKAVGGVAYGWLSNWASLDKTFIFREIQKQSIKPQWQHGGRQWEHAGQDINSTRSEVRPGRLLLSSGMQSVHKICRFRSSKVSDVHLTLICVLWLNYCSLNTCING